MAFQTETILKVPPHAAGDTVANTAQQAVRVTAFTGASAVDQILFGWNTAVTTLSRVTGVWVTWIADADCYIHFESVLISSGQNASATVSLYLPAGVAFDFFHMPKRDDNVRVIQKLAGGNLYRWQSSP